MFRGMFRRKPSKKKAMKELRFHAAVFGAWVAFVRITPYILDYFQKQELNLDI